MVNALCLAFFMHIEGGVCGVMTVHKVLNNNIVSSLDERGREVLLVGRGLGWQTKPGDPVDRGKIDKIIRMDTSASTEKLKQLFLEVDVEVIELSAKIIDHAREVLKKKLNKNVYITLTDHISFAIERMKQGVTLRNALQWETSKLYQNSLNIVRYAFHVEFDEQSLDYQRFTTHLLFFAQRALDGRLMGGGPDEMHELMQRKHPKQFRCAEKIRSYMKKQYQCLLSAEEITFLTVHIVRVTTKL